MYRILDLYRRFYSSNTNSSQSHESFLEHLAKYGRTYSVIAGIVGSGLVGLNFVIGIHVKPLEREMRRFEKNMTDLKSDLKDNISDLTNELKYNLNDAGKKTSRN